MSVILRRLAAPLAAAALAACSTANVAINRRFDYSRVKRVAVIGFRDYPGRYGSGDVVVGAFEQSLLNAGYDVVERQQVDKVLAEQRLARGAVDARAAARLGKSLGVDALLFGQITDLAEARSQVTKVDVVDDRSDPIYVRKTRRVQQPDGSWTDVSETVIEGYKTTHIVRREPRTYTINGRLGVSARLVGVQTGEVIWSGSDSTDTVTFEDGARGLSDDILKAVKATWPLPVAK